MQISWSGFNVLKKSDFLVVKKIVGNHLNSISSQGEVEKLHLHLKKVHSTETSSVYEIHANLVFQGKQYNATIEDRNLFFAIDKVMKKLHSSIAQ